MWTKETGGGVCGNASCRASFERCEEQIRKISRRGANGATRLAEPVAAVIRPGTSGEMDSAFAFRTRFSLRFPQVAPVIRRQLSVAHLFLVFGFFSRIVPMSPPARAAARLPPSTRTRATAVRRTLTSRTMAAFASAATTSLSSAALRRGARANAAKNKCANSKRVKFVVARAAA